MNLEELFSQKLKEVEASGLYKEAAGQDFEFLPNIEAELDVAHPFYLQDAILVEAADQKYDLKELREKKQALEPDDMIEKAHPKSIFTANSLGDGGLVENQNEQHAKMLEVFYKMPTGDLTNIYAATLQALVKIADTIEDQHPEAALMIDETIGELTNQDGLVSAGWEQDRLNKVAFLPLAALVVAAVAGLGIVAYKMLKGVQERLDVDTKDLLSNVEGWQNEPEYSSVAPLVNKLHEAASQLNTLSGQLMSATSEVVSANSPEAEQRLNEIDGQFTQLLDALKSSLTQIQTELPGEWFNLLEAKVETVQNDYNMLHAQAQGAASHAPGVNKETAPPGVEEAQQNLNQPQMAQAPTQSTPDPVRIKAVQQYLNQNGFGNIVASGQADPETKQKLVEFETYINKSEMTEAGLKTGLGLTNLPGNRLAKLLDTSLTADQLHALAEIFHNPSAALASA